MGTRTAAVATGLALTLVLGACGDDDDDSTSDDDQSALCDARSDLSDDLDELQNLDASSTSIDELRDVLDDIGDDVGDIRQAASEGLSDEADEVTSSLSELGDTIADLGSSDSPSDAGERLDEALGNVRTSVENLDEAAADSC